MQVLILIRPFTETHLGRSQLGLMSPVTERGTDEQLDLSGRTNHATL